VRTMLDCLVNYFGLSEDGGGVPRRYFCYHLLAGPGPTEEAGVAFVATLAVHNESERCTSCQTVHAVQTGGPAAALAKAVRYLDAYHEGDRLWKVQSEVRRSGGHPAGGSRLPDWPDPMTRVTAAQ
jgi:hypothetical protein